MINNSIMTFLDDLDKILDDNIQKKYNICLDDKMITKAIDGMLPDPNINMNSSYQLNYLILFDIEFYTLINNNISKFGFIPNDENDKVCQLIREFAMLILERIQTEDDHYWILKRSIFFNTNNEFIYKTLYFMRQNYAKSCLNNKLLMIGGPYLRMLSRYFMTVDDDYDKEFDENIILTGSHIRTKDEFIQKIKQCMNVNITNENYLAYSDHRYYMTDYDLAKYHDSVMGTYINNKAVKNRELGAIQMLNVLKLLKQYQKQLVVVYKGGSDIKAINNTYRIFNWIDEYDYYDGKFHQVVSNYRVNTGIDIIFSNTYDLVYFNGMSHILYQSAKLGNTCNNMLSSRFYQSIIKSNHNNGIESFKEIVSMLNNKNPHDPNYDVLCTLIVAILINLSLLSIWI